MSADNSRFAFTVNVETITMAAAKRSMPSYCTVLNSYVDLSCQRVPSHPNLVAPARPVHVRGRTLLISYMEAVVDLRAFWSLNCHIRRTNRRRLEAGKGPARCRVQMGVESRRSTERAPRRHVVGTLNADKQRSKITRKCKNTYTPKSLLYFEW